MSVSGLILYTTEDGASRIQLRADGQTVWLTQAEMAELFDVTTENRREVRRPVTFYNLDAILAVGYRVHCSSLRMVN